MRMPAVTTTACLPQHCARAWFSLAEVMIVLLIIGLIAGLVGPALFSKWQRAQQLAAKNQVLALKQAMGGFYLDLQRYPQRLEELVKDPGDTKWKGPYLSDGILPKDPWGNEYQVQVPGIEGREFDVFSYGKDNAPGGDGLNRDIYFNSDL